MPSAWSKIHLHLVFSTKRRQAFITPDIRERLYSYIGGIVRDQGGSLYKIGGMPDHIHMLVRCGTDSSVGDLVRHVKSRSSKWVHETFPALEGFAWQEGYGAFSVSESQLEQVGEYIANQEEHHRTRDSREEFLALMRAHRVEFDERFVE